VLSIGVIYSFLLYTVNFSKSDNIKNINSNCCGEIAVNSELNDVHRELPKSSLDIKFIEWFVGLCEAESNFLIRTRKNEKEEVSGFEFVFRITLHFLYNVKSK
jgi:hypothetical protein